jgi:DNA repair protein RadC
MESLVGGSAIIDVAKPLGILVHVIVGRGGHASLKGLKLI